MNAGTNECHAALHARIPINSRFTSQMQHLVKINFLGVWEQLASLIGEIFPGKYFQAYIILLYTVILLFTCTDHAWYTSISSTTALLE